MKLTIEEMKSIVADAPAGVNVYNMSDKSYHGVYAMFHDDVLISDLIDRIKARELDVLRDCDIPPNTIIIDK